MANLTAQNTNVSNVVWLSTTQVAARLGLSRARVTQLVRDGMIPATKPGTRNYRVREVDLLAYIEANTNTAQEGEQ